MTSKQYVFYIFGGVVATLVLFTGINLYVNDFGLFASRDSVRVWTDEKTSKYLMSFRYIPENFQNVIIGPSVSVNMDTRKIKTHKIYNLSMNSGNVTELKFATDNVLRKGSVDRLIICLYPYLTKNSGIKGRQIDQKEYWGSLFSIIPVRMYLRRVKNLIWPNRDIYHSSEWGFADSNLLKKHINFARIVERRRQHPRERMDIDPVAVQQLQSIIDLAHEKNVQVYAYYYPVYFEYLNEFRKSGFWQEYQERMNSLFSEEDIVWDMNSEQYDYITHNLASYSDGHLSDLGADMVLKDIQAKLVSGDKS